MKQLKKYMIETKIGRQYYNEQKAFIKAIEWMKKHQIKYQTYIREYNIYKKITT